VCATQVSVYARSGDSDDGPALDVRLADVETGPVHAEFIGVSSTLLRLLKRKVLPAFGWTNAAMAVPATDAEWRARLRANERDPAPVPVPWAGAEVCVALPLQALVEQESGALALLALGLQVPVPALAAAKRLARVPRCRDRNFNLVEAEVRVPLPDLITADTLVGVRPKDDPSAEFEEVQAREIAMLKTADFVDLIVKPLTSWRAGTLMPRASRLTLAAHMRACASCEGGEYISHLMGAPTHFVSHAWADNFGNFMESFCGAGRERAFLVLVLTGAYLWVRQQPKSWTHKAILIIPCALGFCMFFGLQIPMLLYLFPSLAPLAWNFLERMGAYDDIAMWWMDIFDKNQWAVNSNATKTELAARIGASEQLVLVAHPWDDPEALGRSWCHFELHASIKSGVVITGTMCSAEQRRMHAAITNVWRTHPWYFFRRVVSFSADLPLPPDFHGTLRASLEMVDATRARARFEGDREEILALIRMGDGAETAGDGAVLAHNDAMRGAFLRLVSVGLRRQQSPLFVVMYGYFVFFLFFYVSTAIVFSDSPPRFTDFNPFMLSLIMATTFTLVLRLKLKELLIMELSGEILHQHPDDAAVKRLRETRRATSIGVIGAAIAWSATLMVFFVVMFV